MNIMYGEATGVVMIERNEHIGNVVGDTLVLMHNIFESVEQKYGKKETEVFKDFITENIDLAFMDKDKFHEEINKRKDKVVAERKRVNEDTDQMVRELKISIKDLKESCPEIAGELEDLIKAINGVNDFFSGKNDE